MIVGCAPKITVVLAYPHHIPLRLCMWILICCQDWFTIETSTKVLAHKKAILTGKLVHICLDNKYKLKSKEMNNSFCS